MNNKEELRILYFKLLSWQLWAEIRINKGEINTEDMPAVFDKKINLLRKLKRPAKYKKIKV